MSAKGIDGGSDYCSAGCPCEAEEGDCDSTAECVPGLICGKDAGARYGWAPEIDVCECNLDSDTCAPGCPCDGVLVSSANPTGRRGSLDNTLPLRIGSRSSSVSGLFLGSLDEVSLYQRVLTANEIQAIHQADIHGKCK